MMNEWTRVTTLRDRARRQKVYRHKTPTCPVCNGLECVCRPRYFSGQVLTDADLTAEQQYVIRKNRLHNLYLHGWGVVCGLEVICHPTCEGWVTVRQGYAISPCGDDIIVCEDEDFDVKAAIEVCLRQRRRDRPDDCTPRPATTADCEPDGCWYLRISYHETATRGVTPLRRETQRRTPACTCAPRGCTARTCCGGGCGCGGVQDHTHTNGSAAGCAACKTNVRPSGRPPRMSQPPPCEPTRWCEGFVLDLCKAPAEDPERDRPTWQSLFEGTLLGNILACAEDLQRLVDLAPDRNNLQLTPAQRYAQCCRFLNAARDFFESHPVTRCELLDQLGRLQCPQPPQEAGTAGYAAAVDAVVQVVRRLLVLYLRDCICLQILPPCPEDPGDDHLILACITVRNGEVVDICNVKGRKLVVTWPTVLYWLSVEPLIMRLLERLCCDGLGEGLAGLMLGERRFRVNAAFMAQPVDELDALKQVGGLFGSLFKGFV